MEEKYIAAIDLGSAFITLTVAKILGEDIQILYHKKKASKGIRNSAVFNPMLASGPIKDIIEDAEKELSIKILQVVVGLPRCDIHLENATATVERANPDESITREEVECLKAVAQDTYPNLDPNKETIYGAIAQSFSDDEQFQMIENDIIGVISKKFDGNFKLFIGKSSYIKTLDKLFKDLGIDIAKKYFTPITQAKAVLTSDEISNGVALLDIGGGTTSVTIYQNNILRYYYSIPFGGKVITSDIQTESFISEKLSENLKLAFGACIPDKLQTLGEKIIQIEGDDFEGFKQIPVKYLSEVISARVRELTEAMMYAIQQSGLADKLRAGLVITGGTANLANIALYIKDLSGYNVRIGFPRKKFSAAGCPGVYEPEASTSVGLLLAAKEDSLSSCLEKAPEPDYDNEDDTEPENDTLFTDKVVAATEQKVAKKKEKKVKKPKENKPGIIQITWDKLTGFVDRMQEDMNDQNV